MQRILMTSLTLSLSLSLMAACENEPTITSSTVDTESQLGVDEPMDFGLTPRELVASLAAPASLQRTRWAPGEPSSDLADQWTASFAWAGVDEILMTESVPRADPSIGSTWHYELPVLFSLSTASGLQVASGVPTTVRVVHEVFDGSGTTALLSFLVFQDHGEDAGVAPALVQAVGESVGATFDPSTFGYNVDVASEWKVAEGPSFSTINVNFSSGPRPTDGSNGVAGMVLEATE